MATKIAHAVGDENGNGSGGRAGDQTGREVRVQNWYNRSGGWGVALEPTDEKMAAAAADIAVRIANDDSFGYDKGQRTTAYKAILAAGGNIEAAADSELDCSVLVFIAYKLAGLNIEIGYTGNLESRFLATGKFKAHRESKYLTSGEYAKKGWIYLTAGKHTAIVVTDGSKSGSTSETVSATTDTVKPPYVVSKGTVNIRTGSGTQYERIGTTYNGQKLPYQGTDKAGLKWYMVEWEDMTAFISSNPKYTKLVEE